MESIASTTTSGEIQVDPEALCAEAARLAGEGRLAEAQVLLINLATEMSSLALTARVANDLGVLAAMQGELGEAERQFHRALECRPEWTVPQQNRARLPQNCREISPATANPDEPVRLNFGRTRIAIVSLLFNWPSTGGGTVHTAETARFLTRAGYDVLHISMRFDPWGLGQVSEPIDWRLLELDFTERDWNLRSIQHQLRQAVDEFSPDAVIVTDSWSMKPRLAAALQGYRIFLRLAAQECLCPLNNVRLLSIHPHPESCPRHQLATPDVCHRCVADREARSGTLHRLERGLAGFDEPDYSEVLRQAFWQAEGVLVVNPLIAEMVKPHARAVHVIPSGFDPMRFPWDCYRDDHVNYRPITRILFAGLPEEPMKGFVVLLAACHRLWVERQDFRLVVTSEPTNETAEFCEFLGWQSQAELPQSMREADIVVCPTIAEEALGRTAVEAMGAWRPVVASRIGGLPFTVLDEATGLLCEPGDAQDLARQLARLLDDASLREQMGTLGRRRFEQQYAWPEIIRRYVPLLGEPVPASSLGPQGES